MVEVAAGLSLGAILLIVAIPVLRRELRGSHQAEAREALFRIADAAAAYARSRKHAKELPGAIARTPAEVPRGTAVVVPEEGWAPWRAMGAEVFPRDFPQHYAYSFVRPAEDPRTFEVVAEGDLDGDGVFARAVLRGTIDGSGTVTLAPDIEFIDALE